MDSSFQNRLERFERTWQSPPGWRGWLAAVNNQPLGTRFMLTAFLFFLVGGVLALLMRVQLAVSENQFLGPVVYNQFFTMHGSTMMFLFAVPFLEGLALYLLPLMLGSRDMAFPRLSAFSYWTYLFGGLILFASFLIGAAPAAGWFAYTPLSTQRYSGIGVDFWVLGLGMVELAGITAGAEIVVTILKLRAPGMSLDRMPLFAWAMLVAGVMILFAFTVLLVATALLELDRAAQTRFFDSRHGGSSLLWQHLFWFFGHPEVYIIFLPATGIVSMVVGTFARRIVGYAWIVVAVVLTGFVSFGLWVHHMYTTGLPDLSMGFFAAASLMIGIASGTQVFAWIASLWGRRPPLRPPLLFVLGFLFVFVLGGLTGVMVAVVPFDRQVHDTYFVVAHFHYVLIGGAVFPVLAGLYYWLPKITGRMLTARLGYWSFGLVLVGFNLTFFLMHCMGFQGMPRRVYTYPASLELDRLNQWATVGAWTLGLGVLLFVADFLWSVRRGAEAPDNPWNADSLEWSTASPPPNYNHRTPPLVADRHPTWRPAEPGTLPRWEALQQALDAAPADWRATCCTDAVEATPQAVAPLAGPSTYPLAASLGLLLAMMGVLMKAWLLLPLGGAVLVASLIGWLWPTKASLAQRRQSPLPPAAGLPVFVNGTRSLPYCGLLAWLVVLGTALAALLYSYFYLRLYAPQWPPAGTPRPPLPAAAAAVGLLLLSAAVLAAAARLVLRQRHRLAHLALAGAWLLGTGALCLGTWDIVRSGLAPQVHAYDSIFVVTAGTLGAYVLVGLALIVALQIAVGRDPAPRRELLPLQAQITTAYWYFTVAATALTCGVLYLSPYLLPRE